MMDWTPASNFTGVVTLEPYFAAIELRPLTASAVSFAPDDMDIIAAFDAA